MAEITDNEMLDHSLHYVCPDIYTFEILGGKWRLAIIWTLSVCESVRYNELRRRLGGITNIMLTRALQALEEHGLIKRVDFNENPPHVEYSITDKAREMLPALTMLAEWGKDLGAPNASSGNDDIDLTSGKQ